jgi:Tfp pilus assembly protein PilF
VQQAALNLAEVALQADNPAMAAETLDSMHGIERAQDRNWLGLRIDAAEKLGQKEHAARYQRQLLDLLRRETTER